MNKLIFRLRLNFFYYYLKFRSKICCLDNFDENLFIFIFIIINLIINLRFLIMHRYLSGQRFRLSSKLFWMCSFYKRIRMKNENKNAFAKGNSKMYLGKDLDKKYLDINIKKNRKSIGKMYRFVRKKEFDQKNVWKKRFWYKFQGNWQINFKLN